MIRRLRHRRLSLLKRDYLVYRGLWPAIEQAVASVLAGRRRGDLRVLDVGCGEKPYADLFDGCHYIGVDHGVDGAAPDAVADAMRLPLADACIDIVFTTQVIEHVRHPERMVAEIARVLRPGGALVMTGPFYWPLHEQPHDYHRFTHHGFDNLLRSQGLQPLSITPDCGAFTMVAVAVIELLPRWALALVPVINLVTPLLQHLSTNDLSTLNHVVVGRRPPTTDAAGQ